MPDATFETADVLRRLILYVLHPKVPRTRRKVFRSAGSQRATGRQQCPSSRRAPRRNWSTTIRRRAWTNSSQSRRKDKQITQELTEQLCKTFITPLEREDIQALAAALYKIPKTVEKIGERILIYPGGAAWPQFREAAGIARSGGGSGAGHGEGAPQRHRRRHGAREKCAPADDRRRCGQARARICCASFITAITTPKQIIFLRDLYESAGEGDRPLPRRRATSSCRSC